MHEKNEISYGVRACEYLDGCARVMALFKFDPSHPSLRKTLKEHEELALRYVWEVGEVGANSRDT